MGNGVMGKWEGEARFSPGRASERSPGGTPGNDNANIETLFLLVPQGRSNVARSRGLIQRQEPACEATGERTCFKRPRPHPAGASTERTKTGHLPKDAA